MKKYVWVVFWGIFFVFFYNFFAYLLRAVGNSVTPLLFLAIASVLNIVLDLLLVVKLKMGVGGAAWATVIAQILSGVGIGYYLWKKEPELRFIGNGISLKEACSKEVLPGSGTVFASRKCAAVGDEFRNLDDPGTGQQFRNCRNGSFCSGR